MTANDAPRPRRLFHRLFYVAAALIVFVALVVIGQVTMDNSNSTPGTEATTSSKAPTTAPPATDPNASAAPAESADPIESPLVRRDPDDPMAIGAVDAPVVLIEWTDLRCPFCAAFTNDTLPLIVEEYVDTGLVRIEVHDVAYFGEESENAAVATRAAAEQGMFFEYLDTIYAAAPGSGHADLPRDTLVAFAEETDIPDMARFIEDLDDPDLRLASQESTALAQQIGVTGVPFFLANNTVLSGAQPIDIFRDYLDDALSQVD